MRGTHPIQSLRYRLRLRDADRLKRALRRHLPRDAVIVEAGAHRGEDTADLAHLFPHGHIHAFEPAPPAYEALRATVGDRPNVTCHQLALGTTEGTAPMWVEPQAPNYSSLLQPTATIEVFGGSFTEVDVEIATLGRWAEREGIRRVDGMWLDMQGGELAMLKAAGAIFETTRALILEISSVEMYAGAPLWPEVRSWLQGEGFTIQSEKWEHETYGNALAVR